MNVIYVSLPFGDGFFIGMTGSRLRYYKVKIKHALLNGSDSF